jgi:3-hydroxybutyryl-CoA dehydrogenase
MRVATVGIIGAGTMGSGIAQICARAGLDVVLTDVDEAIVKKGAAAVARDLDRLVAGRRLSIADKEATLARIKSSTGYHALAPADIVIEAATEDLGVKQRILGMIDPLIRSDAIVATNTSSVSITKLAATISRPDRFAGMHFFNPVPVMALVEIVRGLQTSDATHDTVEALATKLGKTPIGPPPTVGRRAWYRADGPAPARAS